MDQALSFEDWKSLLRQDCVGAGKLVAFENIGDYALSLFWKAGVEPTLDAILRHRERPD